MDSSLVTLLTGTGGAAAALGAVLILFITGQIFPKSVVTDQKEENAALKTALAEERSRADAAVAAAQSGRDFLAALQTGMTLGRQPPDAHVAPGGPG